MRKLKRRIKSERRVLKRRKIESQKQPVTLIFDATALSYSVFYGVGTTLSYNGQSTAVIYGFLKKVLQLARQFKTNDLIFAWDAGYSWREINYPQYKQSRKQKKEEASPEEKEMMNDLLYQQIALHSSVLPKIGLKNTFCFEKYEGDDIIGKIVKDHFKERKFIIVSSDSDMYQLLHLADIYLLSKKRLFTHKDFQLSHRIHADQFALAKAIGGCSTDNIVGVKGVGDPKSPTSKALKYIRGEITSGKIYHRIKAEENKCIQKNLQLTVIPYMGDMMPEIKIRKNRVTRRKLIRVFDKYRFISFLEDGMFTRWQEAFCNENKKRI